MDLTPEQTRYLVIGHCLVAFAINFVLNGALGWATFGGVDPVPVWAVESSAGPDLVGTCLFLPAITCLIVTGIVRRHTRNGTVPRLETTAAVPAWLRIFRRGLPTRALLFGAAGLALVGGPLAGGLLSLGPDAFALTPFLWTKAIFSGALGATVQPLIGIVALADPIEA
jgi:hypothetical protein